MSRITKAQKLQQELERQALEFFERLLSGLTEPRRAQGMRYPLRSIVVIALMAMVCGADDAEAMAAWAKAHGDWLAEFLALPHGAPTQDVFLAVFAALDPKEFQGVFRAWAQWLMRRLEGQGKHLAVDGKTSRRSGDVGDGTPALHTVSAWMREAGLVLGQWKTDCKSNEITAIPELLCVLDLRGATVTIDAMGCQTTITSTIVDGEGDYLIAVKDNQPTLRQDIETTFAEARDERRRAVDELARPRIEEFKTVEKGHGRLEERTVTVTRDLDWLTTADKWKKLSFVAEVVRQRTLLSTGKTTLESSYYIGSSNSASVEQVATDIRDHWGIENKLHWVLDIAFRDDDARHRKGNTAENMMLLRHFALNLIKQDKSRKLGVANSRKRAGWDRNYMLQLFAPADG
jgi:predicted transposase YbfD/YdcC